MPENAVDPDLLDQICLAALNLHGAGALSPRVLRAIAAHLSDHKLEHTVETGSGVSTLLFSHMSRHHTVF